MSKKTKSDISHEYLEFEKSQDSYSFQNDKDFMANMNQAITPASRPLLFRFLPVALASGFASLFVCPQYGLTPYNLQPEMLGHLLHQNMFICGLYCGLIYFVFLSLAYLVSFNHFEKIQFKKHYSYVPSLLSVASWLTFMMLSHDHMVVNLNYNLGWILAILVGFGLSFLSKTKTVSRLQY